MLVVGKPRFPDSRRKFDDAADRMVVYSPQHDDQASIGRMFGCANVQLRGY